MSTPNHITQLIRLDKLCKDWSSIHSRSCTYFSSLVNILIQRKESSKLLINSENNKTSNLFFDNFSYSIPPSSISFDKDLLLPLQSQTLTLLIYKQSREIEEIITKIHSILQDFEEIINSMKGILNQSNKLVNLKLSSPSSNSTNSHSPTTSTPTTKQSSSSSSSSSSKKKKKSKQSPKTQKSSNQSSSNPQKKQIDLFDNFENPDDIADIPIISSNLYVVRIVEMYEKELCYKKNLIFGGCFKIDHNDDGDGDDGDDNEGELSGGLSGVKLISERWAAQPYLLFEVEEEMCDRIKIWKSVKEFDSIK